MPIGVNASSTALIEVFALDIVGEGANVVSLGPNGVRKTMFLRNSPTAR